jgi:hypothetical protein
MDELDAELASWHRGGGAYCASPLPVPSPSPSVPPPSQLHNLPTRQPTQTQTELPRLVRQTTAAVQLWRALTTPIAATYR